MSHANTFITVTLTSNTIIFVHVCKYATNMAQAAQSVCC